jgi:hypothetical protein
LTTPEVVGHVGTRLVNSWKAMQLDREPVWGLESGIDAEVVTITAQQIEPYSGMFHIKRKLRF